MLNVVKVVVLERVLKQRVRTDTNLLASTVLVPLDAPAMRRSCVRKIVVAVLYGCASTVHNLAPSERACLGTEEGL